MIQVLRHAETGEISVSSDPEGLVALAEAITHAPAAVETGVPEVLWPYDQVLTSILVGASESLVLIDYDENTAAMRITGSQQSREILAENFVGLAREGNPADHWHVEWFPDHFYLAEGGDPVVVSLDRA